MPDPAPSAVLSAPSAAPPVAPAASPAPAAAPAAAPANGDWYDPTYKAIVDEAKWTGPKDAVASYASLLKLKGLPPDRILDVQNPDWSKLGVPKDVAGYGIAPAAGDNPELVTWFTNTALAAKVPKDAAASMYNAYKEFSAKSIETEQAALTTKFTTDEAKVTAGWGAQTQQNAELIRRVADLAGWDLGALREVAMYSPLGVEGLYNGMLAIAKAAGVKEESFRAGEGVQGGAMDPTQAKATFMGKPKEWTAKAAVKGSAEWNEHQDLQAAMAGMTRAQWDRMMGSGAVQPLQAA